MRGVQGYVERGNADRKSKRPEIARISGRFLMKCVIGAVTLQYLHRFFRLRLNDSAPCYFKSWRKKQKELIKLMDLLNELVVKIISFCGWVIILIELFT